MGKLLQICPRRETARTEQWSLKAPGHLLVPMLARAGSENAAAMGVSRASPQKILYNTERKLEKEIAEISSLINKAWMHKDGIYWE